MAFRYSNGVDASGSTFNDVRDQINIGRDHIIFNFSDMSSESITSCMSGYSSSAHSAPVHNNSATFSSTRRRRHHHLDYSSDEGVFEAHTSASREETRRKRIADEKKRRDELKDGYKTLMDELPVSKHVKSSKVSLLSRATTYIRQLKMALEQAKTSLAQSEAEIARLRRVNEALILDTWEKPATAPRISISD